MVQVPENELTQQDISEWYNLQNQLSKIKAAEMLLRKKICDKLFPDREEGTSTLELEDGAKFKCGQTITREVERGELDALAEDLIKQGIPVPMLIEFVPKLVLREYRKLSEEQRVQFDQVLIVKPGSPSLKIEFPK